MNSKSIRQHRKILGNPLIALRFWDRFGTLGTPLLCSFGQTEQQLEHGLCPGLLLLFCNKHAVA
jgi:hypothetical protein